LVCAVLEVTPGAVAAGAPLSVTAAGLLVGMVTVAVAFTGTVTVTNAIGNGPLQAVWRPDLLHGVMAITGKWKDGSPLLAIPNYARMNRVEPPKEHAAGDPSINYAPGSTTNAGATTAASGNLRRYRNRTVQSKVWIKDQV